MRRVLITFLFMAFFCGGGAEGYAEDWDGNGVDDTVEQTWAEKYKPSFFVNSGNVLEPEPVEILDKNGDGYLSIEDTSAWIVRISDGEIIYEGEYCSCECGLDHCDGEEPFFSIGQGNPVVFGNDAGVCRPYFDYGFPGEIGGDDWRYTYENGQGGTLPGDAYSPKVYCHIFKEEVNKIQVQYWFYYPYDDAFNNHEGDWEHISVILESDGQTEEAFFRGVMYYAHEFYVEISSRLYWESCYEGGGAGTCFYPYMIDDTHPVVFVGGGSRLGDFGSTTGGSWPCYGEFPLPSFPYLEVESLEPGGAVVRFNEVEVEIIPDFLGDFPLSPVAEGWLVENPDKQWMAAELMWGYPLADEPFEVIVGSNQAPFTPTHQSTWRDIYPGTHAGGEGITQQICYRDPIVLVSSENIDNEKEVVEVGYSISIDGGAPIEGVGSKVHVRVQPTATISQS